MNYLICASNFGTWRPWTRHVSVIGIVWCAISQIAYLLQRLYVCRFEPVSATIFILLFLLLSVKLRWRVKRSRPI